MMRAITTSLSKLFPIITAVLCVPSLAFPATLQAKVVEVQSGNSLVVSNINRPIRIRLKAVVPPENGQPFSEAAREHLKLLVFNKTATVEYTHLAEGFLEAKVSVNGIDIGSQMLRDGVAWYDSATSYELTESDRDLYSRCEQAARTEHRGLWQDPSPVAPWEFRRIQFAKVDSIVSGDSPQQSKNRATAKHAALSNDDLFGAVTSTGAKTSAPSVRPIAENGSASRWTRFESATQHFSVLVPSNAVEGSFSTPDSSGAPLALHFLAGGSDRGFYFVVSAKGPNENRTDASALDQELQKIIDGMNQGAVSSGSGPLISVKPARDLRLGSYAGRQYYLSAEGFSGTARVFTKQDGDERHLFVLFALSRPGSESFGNQFLNSFKIVE